MKRLMIAMLAVGLAATAFLVSAQASTPKLVGKVGPDFSITLKKGTIEREKGGPKIEKTLTGTMLTGKKTVAMTLKKGTWKYYCSNHESEMFGFFKVTS